MRIKKVNSYEQEHTVLLSQFNRKISRPNKDWTVIKKENKKKKKYFLVPSILKKRKVVK